MFLTIFANNQNEEKMKENGHKKPQRAVIMGASSGIGYALAQRLIAHGWTVGLAARRTQPLQQLQQQAPERCFYAPIDVTDAHAEAQLLALFQQMGGVDVYVHAAGIGWQNPALVAGKELKTAETNAVGFIRMVGTAYRYFAKQHKGHIVCISSIAGTKGLGPAPAYSATKALQNTYLQALEQLAYQQRLNLRFTDIRPGFVDTPLLTGTTQFPMLMPVERVAKSIEKAIRRQRHVCIIDWRWRVVTGLWRLIPNGLWRYVGRMLH